VTPAKTVRYCAVCVDEPATCFDVIDGRTHEVCRGCFVGDEVVAPQMQQPKIGRRDPIIAMVREQPGMTGRQIADQIAQDKAKRHHIHAALSVLARRGHIRAVSAPGKARTTTYWPATPAQERT
jgi:hypothetical protein